MTSERTEAWLRQRLEASCSRRSAATDQRHTSRVAQSGGIDTITTHSPSNADARTDIEPDNEARTDIEPDAEPDFEFDDVENSGSHRPALAGRANRLTLLATAAAALHVIDDNVVQSNWGGIGDHLASTFVPLAALAGLVHFLPRRRPGTRATMISSLGILGLMLGSEAIYDLASGPLSGDDYTGLCRWWPAWRWWVWA